LVFVLPCAPLFTVLPIIAVFMFVLSKFSGCPVVIGAISMIGALFLAKTAYDLWNAPPIEIPTDSTNPGSIWRGVVTNILNPHPYLFWLTIGAPMILENGSSVFASTSVFVLTMFSAMIGTKLVIAWIAKEFRPMLRTAGYIWLLRISSIALIWIAITFVQESFRQWSQL